MRAADDIQPGDWVWHTWTRSMAQAQLIDQKEGEPAVSVYPSGRWFTKNLLRILTPDEVRSLPVGSVVVDTRTGEECEVVDHYHDEGDIGIQWPNNDVWRNPAVMHDRDLTRTFALKQLPTEDA